jgi:aspartate--ammonia ligase
MTNRVVPRITAIRPYKRRLGCFFIQKKEYHMELLIPQNYDAKLSLFQTQKAIKKLKDFFERQLAYELNLTRVSAPLFVRPETGLNDNLSGVEEPVSFHVLDHQELQIVQSLAKWKRAAIFKYDLVENEGIYTDMNAIRKDETLDNIHSFYVDQWDWERVIEPIKRTKKTLKRIVNQIYKVFKMTEDYISKEYPMLKKKLPEELYYITSQELEEMFPTLNSKQREDTICRLHKAVFISEIGSVLKSGSKHDDRSPDYDDWKINGDLLFYNEVLDQALELSSMGIRVDRQTLLKQLEITGNLDRTHLEYHQGVINNQYPNTIGGGIGQSRLCMFFLEKAHIGEVQSSVWPEEMIHSCEVNQIYLL